MEDLKICVDCRYLSVLYMGTFVCRHPDNLVTDLVDGKRHSVEHPSVLREDQERCGPSAKWFVQKEESFISAQIAIVRPPVNDRKWWKFFTKG